MKRQPLTRRHALMAIGLSALGGCVGQLTEEDEEGIPLGSVRIANTTGDPRTVDLRIERNNESVYHDISEVPGNDEVWIAPTWSVERASYDIYVVISGIEDLQIGRLTDLHEQDSDGDCMFAELWIVAADDPMILTARDVAEQEEATCNDG